jgi:hypothetical protein
MTSRRPGIPIPVAAEYHPIGVPVISHSVNGASHRALMAIQHSDLNGLKADQNIRYSHQFQEEYPSRAGHFDHISSPKHPVAKQVEKTQRKVLLHYIWSIYYDTKEHICENVPREWCKFQGLLVFFYCYQPSFKCGNTATSTGQQLLSR